jgi:hypothetical protein
LRTVGRGFRRSLSRARRGLVMHHRCGAGNAHRRCSTSFRLAVRTLAAARGAGAAMASLTGAAFGAVPRAVPGGASGGSGSAVAGVATATSGTVSGVLSAGFWPGTALPGAGSACASAASVTSCAGFIGVSVVKAPASCESRSGSVSSAHCACRTRIRCASNRLCWSICAIRTSVASARCLIANMYAPESRKITAVSSVNGRIIGQASQAHAVYHSAPAHWRRSLPHRA